MDILINFIDENKEKLKDQDFIDIMEELKKVYKYSKYIDNVKYNYENLYNNYIYLEYKYDKLKKEKSRFINWKNLFIK